MTAESSPFDDEQSPSRLPPYDLQAEESVLGGILIDGSSFEKVRGVITARSFYRQQNAQVYASLETIYLAGGSLDQVSVSNELSRKHEGFDLGYLSHLISVTPTSTHAIWYATLVRRAATSRRAIRYASELVDYAYTDPDEDELTDRVYEATLRISGQSIDQRRLMSASEIFAAKDLEILETFSLDKTARGISTGLTEFDKGVGGLHRGEFGIVAARANMGKSFFATTITNNISKAKRKDRDGRVTEQDQVIAFFSLEMTQEAVFRRIAASEIGVDFDHISQFERDELSDQVYEALLKTAELPFHISETPEMSIEEITAQATMLKNRTGLDMVLIDYLQLIEPPNLGRGGGGTKELEWITRKLKVLARKLDCPVIVLCQLNRAVDRRGAEKSGNFRPYLTDLRGSGSIEQDADWVCFLYRHDFYVQRGMADEDQQRTDRMEFIMGKVREGAIETGLFAFFDPSRARLEDVSEDNDRPGA